MEMTANDRLLIFMAQPPKVEKHGEFGMTAPFLIELQPFIRPQLLPAVFCLRALVSTEIPFVQTEVDLERLVPQI
jgi:hypothetical protein